MVPSQIVALTPAETDVPGAIITFTTSVTNPVQDELEALTVKNTYPKVLSAWEGM